MTDDQVRQSAVWLTDEQGFLGCGFFLTSELILTAAHVLHATEGAVTAHWAGHRLRTGDRRLFPPERGTGAHYGHPDLALLSALDRRGQHGAPLSAQDDPPLGTRVRVCGFSERTPTPGVQPDSIWLSVAGPAADYVRLTGEPVLRGFSGSMVVRTDQDAVCGVLKANRAVNDLLDGGWYTPLTALARVLADDDPLRHLLLPRPPVPQPSRPAPSPARLSLAARARLARAIEATGGMDDPALRRMLIRLVEEELETSLHVPDRDRARDHVFALFEALQAHRDPPRAWAALADVIELMRGASGATEFRSALENEPGLTR